MVYDIMDEMGLPHQCLDLAIAPLERSMQVAGPAYTVVASPDVRERSEMPPDTKLADFGVFTHMYEGCVVVGATGVVIDGGIRDGRLVREIEGFSAFARYTSPIESLRRSRIHDIEVPVSMTGTLTSQVRVDPGDWIFGDEDGVLVIPAGALDEVLAKSEEAKDIEDKVREEVQAGVPVIDVFNKYGRL
ncbi:RraA family protein [Pseudonocardia sp. CA-142604]|uniref:RraA family protein n=1 Tax=Pseudonocardia sp. CA-142604 TaxID=3240024 RepID=UPI003D8FAE31